jgi:hypothetical protein
MKDPKVHVTVSSKKLHTQMAKLRAALENSGRLRLEFMASLSRLCREHNVSISDELLAHVVPALVEELGSTKPPAVM